MTVLRRSLVVALLGFTIAACDGPTEPTIAAVSIYTDSRFQGDQRTLVNTATNDLDDLPGPCGFGASSDWDNCISSIQIATGWSITVFEGDEFSGPSATFATDLPDLKNVPGPCDGNWDDCISSIKVFPPK